VVVSVRLGRVVGLSQVRRTCGLTLVRAGTYDPTRPLDPVTFLPLVLVGPVRRSSRRAPWQSVGLALIALGFEVSAASLLAV
jgi:hypothetical protein